MKVKIFVYGTLQEGKRLNQLLKEIKAEYSNVGWVEGFNLLRMCENYPYAVRGSGNIRGEVYLVDEGFLGVLDACEGVEYGLFERIEVKTQQGDDCFMWIGGKELIRNGEVIESGVWDGD